VSIKFKFNEDQYIKELYKYVESTYNQHYGKGKIQTAEIIIDRGRGLEFCLGNVDKYSLRYGEKGEPSDHRKDLMKMLHYNIIALFAHDLKHGEVNDEDQ
jgi:hypothetical protein